MKQGLLAGLTVLIIVFIDFMYTFFTGLDTGKLGKFDAIILYYVAYISIKMDNK